MNDLKDFLMPQDLVYPVNQRIETEIMYPVSFSQSQVKFVFDKKGILDANSQVRLKLKVAKQGGGADTSAFLPINTGISSIVNRAWLEIGGRRVSTLERVGDFNTFLNMGYTPDYRQNILQPKEGYYGSVGPASAVNDTQTGVIGIAPLVDDIVSSQFSLTDDDTSPEFALALSRLVPMLKGFQIPLFAIDQEVSLVIEWNTKGLNGRFQIPTGSVETASTIDEESCVLMTDYLYYPENMNDIAMKIGSPTGYSHFYEEVLTIESTENSLGTDPGAGLHQPSKYSHQLALAGKTVKSIIVQPVKVGNALCGDYVANDDQIEDNYNWVIDSKPYYANDIKNSAFKYKEACSVLGRSLSINNWEYCFLNQVSPVIGAGGGIFTLADSGFTDLTLEGHTQQLRTADQSWRGVSFAKESLGVGGRKISNLPILFNRTRQIMNANVYPTAIADFNTSVLMRFFAITTKILLMRNGQTTVVQ